MWQCHGYPLTRWCPPGFYLAYPYIFPSNIKHLLNQLRHLNVMGTRGARFRLIITIWLTSTIHSTDPNYCVTVNHRYSSYPPQLLITFISVTPPNHGVLVKTNNRTTIPQYWQSTTCPRCSFILNKQNPTQKLLRVTEILLPKFTSYSLLGWVQYRLLTFPQPVPLTPSTSASVDMASAGPFALPGAGRSAAPLAAGASAENNSSLRKELIERKCKCYTYTDLNIIFYYIYIY